MNIAALTFVLGLCKKLIQKDKNCRIAILSPYIKGVGSAKTLRSFIYPQMAENNNNIDINTIDGVQGMTTQFTILFIPPRGESFSFNLNRFNVATSRSELCTLIITDKIYQQILPGNELVNQYLKSICF